MTEPPRPGSMTHSLAEAARKGKTKPGVLPTSPGKQAGGREDTEKKTAGGRTGGQDAIHGSVDVGEQPN